MDVEGVAEYLGLAASTVYDKVRDVEIPHTRIGALIRFRNSTSTDGSEKTPYALGPICRKLWPKPPSVSFSSSGSTAWVSTRRTTPQRKLSRPFSHPW